MNHQVAIVALNMFSEDANFLAYNNRSAHEKIDYLCSRIESISTQLMQLEPNSRWIIAWREYGITGADSRYISDEEKKYLKKRMQALTEKYPQLVLLSGTVAAQKQYNESNSPSKLEKVESFYNEFTTSSDNTESRFHAVQVKQLKSKKPQSITVVRNTCYLFVDGNCISKDKTVPYLETADTKDWWLFNVEEMEYSSLPNTVFQPGNKKNAVNTFTLGDDTSREPTRIGIEICREHEAGVLQNEIKNTKSEYPEIHFILSYGMGINLNNVAGKYCLLLDQSGRPQLILSKDLSSEEISGLPIRLYQNNVLLPDAKIVGPLQPAYPPQLKILKHFDDIDDFIETWKVPSKEKKRSQLKELRDCFVDDMANGAPCSYFVDRMMESANYKELITRTSFKDLRETKQLTALLTDLMSQITETKFNLRPGVDDEVQVMPVSGISITADAPKDTVDTSRLSFFTPPDLDVQARNFAQQKLSGDNQFAKWIANLLSAIDDELQRNPSNSDLKTAKQEIALVCQQAYNSFKKLYTVNHCSQNIDADKVAEIESECLNNINEVLVRLTEIQDNNVKDNTSNYM